MFMKWLVVKKSEKLDCFLPLALFSTEIDAKHYIEMLQHSDVLEHHYIIKEIASEKAMMEVCLG